MDPVLSGKAMLLVAHPGHELLLSGWLSRVEPFVCVLTDGSGHSAVSRLHLTRELVASSHARPGPIFGRFKDREIYDALLTGRVELFAALAEELATFLSHEQIDVVVTDAMEGFNPVHDLCRVLAGAACDLAGRGVRYEYPVHAGPEGYDELADATLLDLDDTEFARKLAATRVMAEAIPDIVEMLSQFGERAFRREAFRPAGDWTASGWPPGQAPLYEQIGEERIALGRYDRVIRHREHFVPLMDALRSMVLQCAS